MHVLKKNRAWHIRKKLDVKVMKKGAKILLGTHDFSTFRTSSCEAKSPIKTIEKISIKKSRNKITLKFVSKSFLQQQVRSMVGCLKYVAEKKWNVKKFEKVFKSKKRILCAPPAPAHGLFLEKVIGWTQRESRFLFEHALPLKWCLDKLNWSKYHFRKRSQIT